MNNPDGLSPGQVLGKRHRDDFRISTPTKQCKGVSALTSYPTPESTPLPSTDSASEEVGSPSASISSLNSRKPVLEEQDAFPQSRATPADTARARLLEDLNNYIPLGSLTLRPSIGGAAYLHRQEWIEAKSGYNCGLWLAFHDYLTANDGHPAFSARTLAENQWVRVFARKHQKHHELATLRVYALPDDVGRRYVDRQALRNLRGYLDHLLNELDISPKSWDGHNQLAVGPIRYSIETKDEDSLFYLFNTLPSPAPCPSPISCPISNDAIHTVFESTRLPGLITELYPYQRRTVATMIKREVEPDKALDPRFQPLKSPTGQTFYYDNVTATLLRDRRDYSEACGGILGESMGLGKTLICLATIVATKGNWPEIPPEYSLNLLPVRPRVGSLMEMAAAAVGRAQVPWRAILQESSRVGEDHKNCLAALENNVGSYFIPPPEAKYSRRSSVIPRGVNIRLSSATLIIVPQNLLSQWRKEISTHIEDDRLKILYLDTGNEVPIPSADELLSYDIVLISRSRFEKEMVPSESAKASSKAKKARGGCMCSLDEDCHCSRSDEYRTPLKDIHFLRIIMDEGHEFSSSGRGGTVYWALRNLHVDRKWIVSGTPASGLLGVEVETATCETSKLSADGSIDHKYSNQNVLETRRKESALSQERKDLENLGILVCGFLQAKPWANSKEDDPASWQKYVMPHNDGRRKARSLKILLQSLVVRHRIEDIEADIQLPPLHNQVVYLQPSWHDKLSINLFIIFLTVNAVTSGRVDQDYMFHAKNRRQLHILINNLRHSGFYWTGVALEDISNTVKLAQAYLKDSGCNEPDRRLLEQAISIGELVQASASWRSFAEFHEMGVFVTDFPQKALESWSLVPDKQGQGELLLTGTTQLAKAQKWVNNHLYANDPANGLAGMGDTTMQKLRQASINPVPRQEQLSKVSPMKKKHCSNLGGVPRLTNERTVSRAKAAPAPRKSKKSHPSQQPLNPSDGSKLILPTPALKSALKTPASKEPVELLPTDSVLGTSKICGTASAKLSYLVDKVSILHQDEKILIFYENDSIAWYLAQCFDLLDIRYLIYTKTLSQARLTAYITTFNTTETFRVLFMNVYDAAHGLHIASASRVFFVNPVWQPNVEAQAIKRAHRIGQNRPVYVETLVLRNTIEDQMLQRRKKMTAQEHQKAERSLLDDNTMSKIIQNARFLPLPDDEIHDMEKQMAKLEKPQQLFARVGKGEGDVDDPDADLIFPENIPMCKRQKRTQQRTTARETEWEATTSSVPPSPSPASVPDTQPNGLLSNFSLHNEASNARVENVPGPSNRKRKSSDEDAPDLDALQSPTKTAPPASLTYQSGVGPASGSTRRVGFGFDQDDPPSLFGGSSSAGPSSGKRKRDLEHIPDLDGLGAPTTRMPPASLTFSATPNTSVGSIKRVGFHFDTDDAEPHGMSGGNISSTGSFSPSS